MRAVIFDLYNTLVPGITRRGQQECAVEMGVALGVAPDRFADAFRHSWGERFRGELGDLRETIRALAVRAGGSPSDPAIRLAEVIRLRLIRRVLWPSAETLSILDDLRESGVRVGLLSNCSVETAVVWPQQPLAQRFDVAGLSCEVGLAKPDPAYYLKVCGELGAAPADCVYVGDGENDELAAAASLGMRTIRTTQFTDSDPSWRGETISSLTQLVRV